MKVIGFGGTYYTGWEMVEERRDLGNGRTYAVEHWYYCQNLSKDPDIARAKWGTDDIDMDLRGHRSFDKVIEIVPDGCFRYGKFKNKPYDVADGGYLGWYYENGVLDSEREEIENILIEKHGWVRMPDGRCISDEDYRAEMEWDAKNTRTKKLLNGDSPIELTAQSNLNEYGELLVNDNDVSFTVKFNDWKEMWYNGWPYGMPLDKKGKAKRIKNKVLCIKKWNVLSDCCIEAVEWEIKKL